jgi:signal transduction histidine kinase
MTLRAKILLKMAALLLCFGLLGSFAVWGFASLRSNIGASRREFRELQQIRSVSVRLAMTKATFEEGPQSRSTLLADLRGVLDGLHTFIRLQEAEYDDEDSEADRQHDVQEQKHAEKAIELIGQMQSALASDAVFTPPASTRFNMVLGQASSELDGVAGECAKYLNLVHSTTHTTVLAVLIAMSALSLIVLGVTTAVGFSLYRNIVFPLHELQIGVREIAAGHFTKRLPERGDPEFLAVIREFNQMAGQLEEFYLRLEDKVAEKSRELVRSERLASVGFLAAGVAHEIRNPLGIISGYAELSLKMLAAAGEEKVSTREGRILGVIRDEAFRCKQITEKLLGLVQGGSEGRQPVELSQIVRDVTFLLKGLATFRERQAELYAHVPHALWAQVNPIEMKQVLLNLMLNALDAVEVGAGRIDIEGRRVNGHVELCVRDNGCGISSDSIPHVFEPFYTSKRGRSDPGTGLGLSISHAIICQYGGIIRAESDGPGRGSRFTIELPAVETNS